MLRIDPETRTLTAAPIATMRGEEILERADFQAIVVNSWESFASELGFPNLRFIGQEIEPHESAANRLDLLALDEDEGKAVVIELKRDHHRLQLLQALSYAAMVSRWPTERYAEELGEAADDDLMNSIENIEEGHSPRVVLIAESFDPEVILTADWLTRGHDVDIQCYSIKLHRLDSDRLISLQLDYPVRGLHDLYRARRSAPRRGPARRQQSWDQVKQWIDYEWGVPFIDWCLGIKQGDPNRRRFLSMLGTEDWGSMHLTFQKVKVRVVIYGRRDGDIERWRGELPGVEITTWGSDETRTQGLACNLTTQAEAENLLRAAGVEPSTVFG